jgi:hypothetical protein
MELRWKAQVELPDSSEVCIEGACGNGCELS